MALSIPEADRELYMAVAVQQRRHPGTRVAAPTLASTVRRRLATMTEQTLNPFNMLVVVVLTALAVRWYMSKPANNAARPAAASRSGPRVSPAQIEQVASMFPQLDRRSIAWDLSRNGGNVSATTEKVLSGRALDTVSAV
jgi:hypothetical protein